MLNQAELYCKRGKIFCVAGRALEIKIESWGKASNQTDGRSRKRRQPIVWCFINGPGMPSGPKIRKVLVCGGGGVCRGPLSFHNIDCALASVIVATRRRPRAMRPSVVSVFAARVITA